MRNSLLLYHSSILRGSHVGDDDSRTYAYPSYISRDIKSRSMTRQATLHGGAATALNGRIENNISNKVRSKGTLSEPKSAKDLQAHHGPAARVVASRSVSMTVVGAPQGPSSPIYTAWHRSCSIRRWISPVHPE